MKEPFDQRDASIEAEIAALRDLCLDDLRRRWRAATGQAPPSQLPRFLLLRMLAYRLQARIFGDLDKASADLLDRIAEAMTNAAARPGGPNKSRLARSPSIVPPVTPRSIKPGAMLVREWKGVLHRVTILEQGFDWNGVTYDSLSKIARAITGTEWSGPRFFGLRDGKTERRLNEQPERPTDKRQNDTLKSVAGFRRGKRNAALDRGGRGERQRLPPSSEAGGDRVSIDRCDGMLTS